MESMLKQFKSFKQIRPDHAWLRKTKDQLMADFFVDQKSSGIFGDGWAIKVGSLATAFILAVIGTTASVSFAQNSLPGDHLLYPIKIAAEKVQFKLANNGSAKADLGVEFANRRLHEFSQIVNESSADELAKKEKDLAQVVGDFTKQVAAVSEQVNNLVVAEPSNALPLARQANLEAMKYENTLLDADKKISQTRTEAESPKKELKEAMASVQQIKADYLKVLAVLDDAQHNNLDKKNDSDQVAGDQDFPAVSQGDTGNLPSATTTITVSTTTNEILN